MPEDATHGHNLALVMEGMRQDMMNDEGWSADGTTPIRITQLHISIELLIRQSRQIREGLFTDFALQESGISDGGVVAWIPIAISPSLKRVDPESFAIENMNHLLAERRKSEARHFPCVVTCGNRGQMVEHQRKAAVRPGMEFPNAVNGKH